MSEHKRISRELDVAAEAISNGGSSPLEIVAQEGRFRAQLTDVNRLACAFTDVAYSCDKFLDANADRLRKIAGELSTRLSYLLEPVQPIEVDPETCVIQMRSLPPSQEERTTRFYELVVRPGNLDLRRYEKPKGEARRVIPAEVTREVLVRLASDFAAAADQ